MAVLRTEETEQVHCVGCRAAAIRVKRSTAYRCGACDEIRDRFATSALNGYLASDPHGAGGPDDVARAAYLCADAMLKERG